jgi:hypothetical protein
VAGKDALQTVNVAGGGHGILVDRGVASPAKEQPNSKGR